MKLRMLKTFLLTGSAFCLAFSSPAYATLKEALEALNDQDYGFAFEELTRLSEKEQNSEAKYHLGRIYSEGKGVEKDLQTALKFYREAAEQGNGKAALKLGNMYYTGSELEKDYPAAFKWYSIAAEKGNYPAQYNIGLMYEEGSGVKKDYIKAFQFYKKSGEQGYAPAQIVVGRMFLNGIGTPQDYAQAVFWYKLAADQGNTEAQMKLAKLYANTSVRGLPFNIIGAHIYFNLIAAYASSPLKEEGAKLRDELTGKMRNEDVIEAQKAANKWKKKSREESLPSLVANVIIDDDDLYASGHKKSKAEAEEKDEQEIKITVKTDIKDLLVAVGVSRRDLNKAVRADDFSAIETFLKEKAEKDEDARLALADLYVLGQGLKENPQEAIKIYQKLADDNNAIAFFRLAPMYCEGNGVEPDLAECYKMMLLAQKYADEDSAAAVAESVQMLDENLDKEIREAGKKLFDEREEKKASASKGKKKLFGLFGGEDDKKENKKKDKEKSKKEKAEEEDIDDLFSGL